MVLCRHEGAYTNIASSFLKHSYNSNTSQSASIEICDRKISVQSSANPATVQHFQGHRICHNVRQSRILSPSRVVYTRLLLGVNVGAHELFTPSELMGGLRCPTVIVNGKSKIVGGAARWTAVELDGQLTLISAHLPHKGRKLGEFETTLTELQEFLNGRHKQHVILGGDFDVNLFGMTD